MIRQKKMFEELRREDELVQGIKVEFITDEDGYVCIKPKELISVIEFIARKHIAEAVNKLAIANGKATSDENKIKENSKMEKYDRKKEIKYLQNIINNIEKYSGIAEVAVDANVFLEIARCFINNCKPLKEENENDN